MVITSAIEKGIQAVSSALDVISFNANPPGTIKYSNDTRVDNVDISIASITDMVFIDENPRKAKYNERPANIQGNV